MITWMDKGIRDEVDCAQFANADPRDARIAELEAALRVIRDEALAEDVSPDDAFLDWIGAKASTALMPPPERDMAITQEAMDA